MDKKYQMIHDNRIDADSYILEMSMGDYYELIKGRLNDNEYQRKRVRNSGSIYELLKQDLIRGCVIPPIVLAFSEKICNDVDVLDAVMKEKDRLIILDGLQRSYTIKEIVSDNDSACQGALKNKIRVELYTGINKLGVLYRMLTLNAGQTQMSVRHQIEIIYSDYKNRCTIPNVRFLTETDGQSPTTLGEYKFRDVVDGFTSYIQRDYLVLDRMDILDNVKNLKSLAKNDKDKNLFDSFISCYHSFVSRINEIVPDTLDNEIQSLNMSKTPFGTSVIKIFNKSQPLTGFGNAVASLMQAKVISDFEGIKHCVDDINANTVLHGLLTVLSNLNYISTIAKKIGNDQRLYFYQLFKCLFDQNAESYGDLDEAASNAKRQYERITL